VGTKYLRTSSTSTATLVKADFNACDRTDNIVVTSKESNECEVAANAPSYGFVPNTLNERTVSAVEGKYISIVLPK
jgi:hypothetical protein